MDWEQLHQDLSKVLEDLAEKNRRAPIIVEGEYDRRALRALGLKGDVRLVNEGSSVFGLCESIAAGHREAIILTDWDVRGGRLARQLREGLAANGVKFDEELRARLTRLCRKDITDVESLDTFVERVNEHVSAGDRRRDSKRWYSDRVFRRNNRRRSRK
jgi:5S rRNA maturation endonuclease (ribonuclease M5)